MRFMASPQNFDISFYEFSENHIIFKKLILTTKSIFCHFDLGNRLEHIFEVFLYRFIHILIALCCQVLS